MKKPAVYKHAVYAIADLIPYVNNARTHSIEQINQLAASIKEWGFTNPVLIDEDGGVIAGHGRILAAEKLGLDKVPCIILKGLTEAQKKAYIIADNQLALNAGWDEELLKVEIQTLSEMDFDLDALGFDADFIEDMFADDQEEEYSEEEETPEAPDNPVSMVGDVWQLGQHRLMCGDATDNKHILKLCDGRQIDMVYTDPPYGISIVKNGKVGGDKAFGSKGKVGGDNVVKANSYAPIAGDDSTDVAKKAIENIIETGIKNIIIWGGNYYASALPDSPCWIVWDKQNTGNFADCELAWTNQPTAARIFKHTWNGMIKESEKGDKRVHPTQKPIALAEWTFDQYGHKVLTVLDLFGGSGSTLLACETRNKHCYMMELAEAYIDVIVERWQNFTGKEAIHLQSGLSYEHLKAKRLKG